MSNMKYFDLSIPAPRRLAMMKKEYQEFPTRYPNCPPKYAQTSWKDARGYTHKNWQWAFATLSPGIQDGQPIWYTHQGEEFKREKDAHVVRPSLESGWYTDTDNSETAVGIVVYLSRGKLLAGYRWTANDERVYLSEIYTDPYEAAYAANRAAEKFAEETREDAERYDAMMKAEIDVQDADKELRDTWALRRMGRRTTEDVRDAIEALRTARAEFVNAKLNGPQGPARKDEK